MRKGKNRVCSICDKLIRPGGMGGHVRLAHGIKVKTIVKYVRDVRGDVPGGVGDVPGDMHDVRDVRDVRHVQRPSDYVPKRVVVETQIEPAPALGVPEPLLNGLCEEARLLYDEEMIWAIKAGYPGNFTAYMTDVERERFVTLWNEHVNNKYSR